jgi:hypothetical protein
MDKSGKLVNRIEKKIKTFCNIHDPKWRSRNNADYPWE